MVTSRFRIEGQPVTVTTACHPKLDAVAARIESPLIRAGRLRAFVDAPGDDDRQFANFVGTGPVRPASGGWAAAPGGPTSCATCRAMAPTPT